MKLTFEEACSSAADLFEAAPETWTRGVIARDDRGNSAFYHDYAAVSFCLVGALKAMGHRSPWRRLEPFANKLGFDDSDGTSCVSANNRGGRLVAIKVLRMAAGEIE